MRRPASAAELARWARLGGRTLAAELGVVRSRRFVAPMLVGGLGNQLFEVAAARAVALRTGRALLLRPVVEAWPSYWDTLLAPLVAMPEVVLAERNDPFRLLVGRFDSYVEPDFAHRRIPEGDPRRSLVLHGYFQSSKYFADDPRDWVDPLTDEVAAVSRRLFATSAPADRVLVHVRRGDTYRLNQGSHPVVSASYYHEAIDLFGRDRPYVVMSDDIAWCREAPVFAGLPDVAFVPDDVADHVALVFGAACSGGVVMANSTFSWWAVVLGDRDRPVVAPSPWFGPDLAHDTRDLYEPGWQILEWS